MKFLQQDTSGGGPHGSRREEVLFDEANLDEANPLVGWVLETSKH